MTRRGRWLAPLLQVYSLLVTGFLFLSIFSIYTNVIGLSYALPAIVTIALGVALRYTAVHHSFSNATIKRVVLAPLSLAFAVSGIVSVDRFVSSVTVRDLVLVFQHDVHRLRFDNFLPEWWIVGILLPAGGLVLLGCILSTDATPYPEPTGIRRLAISPVLFGFVCAFFGLWAVLFVGFRIQRVIVIAPVFEELLKFGVALAIGSALFGRSFTARVGIAIVIGSLFGVIEHATTYPTEADTVYVFRTAFHSITTALSVGVYTSFESQEERRLQWISPIFSMALHFFFNTFVVLSSVILVVTTGSQSLFVPLVYEAMTILLATILVVLAKLRPQVVTALHRPFELVLSDLV